MKNTYEFQILVTSSNTIIQFKKIFYTNRKTNLWKLEKEQSMTFLTGIES